MADISRVSSTSVERATTSVSSQNFNIPALALHTTAFAARSKIYASAAEWEADHPAAAEGAARARNLAGLAFFAMNPRPKNLKALRLALPSTKVVLVTPTAANSKAYKLKVNGTEVVYTSDSSATAQEIVEGLKTLIDALAVTGLTITEDNVALTFTGGSGVWFSVELTSSPDDGQMTIDETTADPGIATDLAAIQAADKDWYAFTTIDQSHAITTAAAAWAESNGKFFAPCTQDSDVPTSSTSDVATALKNSGYDRTMLGYHHAPDQFMMMRFLARIFTAVPGSRVAFHKKLPGLTVSDTTGHLTTAGQGYLDTKRVLMFIDIGGNGVTDGGKVASGEWADIIWGGDYYDTRSEVEDAETLLSEVDKLPGDEDGIRKLTMKLRAIVQEMEKNRFIRLDFTEYPEEGFLIVEPTTADIDPLTREITGHRAEVMLANAIKQVRKTITLRAA